jgi:hypothetical protein
MIPRTWKRRRGRRIKARRRRSYIAKISPYCNTVEEEDFTVKTFSKK